MTQEERLNYCKICVNRKMDPQNGLVCELTDEKASFEDECVDFKVDQDEVQRYKTREAEVAEAETQGGTFGPEHRGIQKGMVGGIIMILIAVIWFVVGWALGYLFLYPPILFCIGLYALVRGIISGNISGEKK